MPQPRDSGPGSPGARDRRGSLLLPDFPADLVESDGDLLVADTENGRLRRVQHPLPVIGTLSPAGTPADGVPIAIVVYAGSSGLVLPPT